MIDSQGHVETLPRYDLHKAIISPYLFCKQNPTGTVEHCFSLSLPYHWCVCVCVCMCVCLSACLFMTACICLLALLCIDIGAIVIDCLSRVCLRDSIRVRETKRCYTICMYACVCLCVCVCLCE